MDIEHLGEPVGLHPTDNDRRRRTAVGILVVAAVALGIGVPLSIWHFTAPWGTAEEAASRRSFSQFIGGVTALGVMALVFGIPLLMKALRTRDESYSLHERGFVHRLGEAVTVVGWGDHPGPSAARQRSGRMPERLGLVASSDRPRRLARAALCVSALALTAASFGCGGEDGQGSDGGNGGQADDGASGELVDWMGQLCEAVSQSVQGLPSPISEPEATTEADRQPLLDFLAEAQSAVSTAQEAADALPDPPTAAAGEVAEAFRGDLDGLASELSELTTSATVLPADRLANVYVVGGVAVVSFSPGGEEMSDYLDGRPALAEAYREAPSCSGERTTTTASEGSEGSEGSGPSTTAGTQAEREAALLEDIRTTFADEPGGDQQVLETVYQICASLDATDPDRFFPPEGVDPAQASSLAETLAGQPPTEVLDSLGRVLGNPVTVLVIARLGAEHICPEHGDAIEAWAASGPPPPGP